MTKNYQLCNDIDWFAEINGIRIHVASNGGLLPDYHSQRPTQIWLVNTLQQVMKLPMEYDYVINSDYIENEVINGCYDYLNEIEGINNFNLQEYGEGKEIFIHNESLEMRLYSRSFVELARRGFYSFDRHGEGLYHLVAKPIGNIKNDKNISNIPVCNIEGLLLNDVPEDTLNNIELVQMINESLDNYKL